jgi:hypothetical protein
MRHSLTHAPTETTLTVLQTWKCTSETDIGTRPKGSADAVHDTTSRPSSVPLSNGWWGATAGGSSRPSAMCHRGVRTAYYRAQEAQVIMARVS